MKIAALESGLTLPAIFTDAAFTRSGGDGNFVLSSSFLAYTSQFGGVAPMVKDGYGCFYKINADRFDVAGSM